MAFLKTAFWTIFLLLLLWIGGYVYFGLSAVNATPQRVDEPTDAIVVLTGGQGRIETGLELFAEDKSGFLFITGVHPYVRRSDIRHLWKQDESLPLCCIVLGYEARTTQQNAQETGDWLAARGFTSIRLVTGNFHMARALHEFQRAMPDIDIIPHPVSQPGFEATEPGYWVMVFSEYNKTLFRRIILPFEHYLPESITNLQLNPQDILSTQPESPLQ